ncbi:MAG: putative ABC transporter permease [Arachnia sp.]
MTRADGAPPNGEVNQAMQQQLTPAHESGERPGNVGWLAGTLGAMVRLGFLLAAVGAGVLATWFLIILLEAGGDGQLSGQEILASAVFLLSTASAVVGAMVLTVMPQTPQTLGRARMIARVSMVTVLVSVVFSIFGFGLHPVALIYLYMLGWLIYFQSATDPQLDRSRRFTSPWGAAVKGPDEYIALNFFNLFWVFLVASVIGLIVEVIFHAMTVGGYQDRAGVLWGPFSPIYGFGALLMTIALNRVWKRSKLLIFVVAGLIGAAFEFFVSWFMETAFGIIAWDYSGTFLNIEGRTNFAFACAWGFLGLVWIKLLLPDVLRIVDAIPLRWRTWLTVVTALFMLINGVMTLVTIDSWHKRVDGDAPDTPVQRFCAEHFDNDYMSHRFQSMDIDAGGAQRLDEP